MKQANQIDAQVVANSLRALRLSRGYTQSELGTLMGYDCRTIRRNETDGTDRLSVINAYSSFFEVSAMDILSGMSIYFYRAHHDEKSGGSPRLLGFLWQPSPYHACLQTVVRTHAI